MNYPSPSHRCGHHAINIVRFFRAYLHTLAVGFVLGLVYNLQAIVTSDDPPPPDGNNGIVSHLVLPNSKPYGMDLDGVARLYPYTGNTIYTTMGGGVRLSDSNYILTAAHVVIRLLGNNQGLFDGVRADFNGINSIPVGATNTYNNIILHPQATVDLSIPRVDVSKGFDVALIRMSHIPDEIPGYQIYTGDPLGGIRVIAGYGKYGYGDIGDVGTANHNILRAGLNIFEAHPDNDIHPGIANGETQIAFDFEQPGEPDTSYYNEFNTLGLGNDEVGFGEGDSGGPSFAGVGGDRPKIAGIHSYGANGVHTDVSIFDNTWGEVHVDSWVGHKDILSWIKKTVYDEVSWQGDNNPSNQSTMQLANASMQLSNASNWYESVLPDHTMGASIELGGTYTIDGPQIGTSLTFRDLAIGGDMGIKTLSFSGGGSFAAVDHFTIEQNAVVQHQVGGVSAPSVIVGNQYGGSPAQYFWSDINQLGTSSITADQIIVGPGGDFVHDWANWTTGTLSGGGLSGLFSTHPKTAERIAKLRELA